MSAVKESSMAQVQNANFPMTAEGATYHVGALKGQLASRILTVGDPARAKHLAALLDSVQVHFESYRGFTFYTGSYKGVRMSIISIGMGYPMMDMMVREVRAVTEGPLALIRLGSCGSVCGSIPVGSLVVASSGLMITRNFSVLPTADSQSLYHIGRPWDSDPLLTRTLMDKLQEALAGSETQVLDGLNASADSFYSSQGRRDSQFKDGNEDLIDRVLGQYPGLKTLEMETSMLLALSHLTTTDKLYVSGVAMVFANRVDNSFIDKALVADLELKAGKGVLETLLHFPLEKGTSTGS